MDFKDRLNRRDDSALENYKKATKRGEMPQMKDTGPPSRNIDEGYDPTKRDLGFQKESLEQEVYGEHFGGKKKFVKDYEEYYKKNQDIEI